ncbi:MAG: metallophosphoesterase family protein [Caldilineales bacterium]|nr:metallophosphoesterase family protein [Caldilineales bacterium]
MLYAILSDIHGNSRALEQVLAYLAARPIDAFLHLGDVGPEPLFLFDPLPVQHIFGNWEVTMLDDFPAARREEVGAWPGRRRGPGWVAAHATPLLPEPCQTTLATRNYMRSHAPRWTQIFPSLLHDEAAIWAALAELALHDQRVAFYGHTHVQAAQQLGADNRLRRLSGPLIDLPPDARTLIGVGSVGAPADGNAPRFALFDSERMQVTLIALPR